MQKLPLVYIHTLDPLFKYEYRAVYFNNSMESLLFDIRHGGLVVRNTSAHNREYKMIMIFCNAFVFRRDLHLYWGDSVLLWHTFFSLLLPKITSTLYLNSVNYIIQTLHDYHVECNDCNNVFSVMVYVLLSFFFYSFKS